MERLKPTLFAMLCLCLLGGTASAQETPSPQKSGSLKFVLTGDYYTGLRYVHDAKNNTDAFSFTTNGVNPVFLWKLSDKMIFEGEVEFQNRNPHGTGYAVGEGLEIELEYANIGYILNDYMIFRAGG